MSEGPVDKVFDARQTPRIWILGAALFDELRLALIINGERVRIPPTQARILSMLLHAGGRVVSEKDLADRVWQGPQDSQRAISLEMRGLQRSLRDEAARIISVHGRGYRFDFGVDVRCVSQPAESEAGPLRLQKGQPVPHREGQFILERDLGGSPGGCCWLARNHSDGELRVFRFAEGVVGLSSMRREAAMFQLFARMLGERRDIVRLYSADLEQPPYLLELEHGGDDLRYWAAEAGHLKVMGVPERLELFRQIAGAIRALHSIDVLFVDLKPGNILLSPSPSGWQVRLAGFGSCRILDPERLRRGEIQPLHMTTSEHPGTGVAAGTFSYLAPERLKKAPATRQSDIYALGLLLYQMLANDFDRPLAPGWERDIADPLLRGLVAAATDVDPARRIATVDGLLGRLSHLSGGGGRKQIVMATIAARLDDLVIEDAESISLEELVQEARDEGVDVEAVTSAIRSRAVRERAAMGVPPRPITGILGAPTTLGAAAAVAADLIRRQGGGPEAQDSPSVPSAALDVDMTRRADTQVTAEDAVKREAGGNARPLRTPAAGFRPQTGEPSVSPVHDYATPAQVMQALEQLTPPNHLRLQRLAHRCSVGTRFADPRDLCSAAFNSVWRAALTRAAGGEQADGAWRTDMDFMAHLFFTVRRIASEARRGREPAVPVQDDGHNQSAAESADVVEELVRDEEIRAIVEGQAEGLTSAEIQKKNNMTRRQYENAEHRLARWRRAIGGN